MQPEDSFLQHMRPVRAQRSMKSLNQPVGTRPLSSADETGPVTKKLRSTNMRPRAVDGVKSTSSIPLTMNDRSKKARARPALTLANIFSSSGRRSQSTATSSRLNNNNKNVHELPSNPGIPTRRSSRLLTGPTHRPSKVWLFFLFFCIKRIQTDFRFWYRTFLGRESVNNRDLILGRQTWMTRCFFQTKEFILYPNLQRHSLSFRTHG
jgi:hypothetical protein